MALTKHEKLARGMSHLLNSLEEHFQKTAKSLNCLQLFFYETHLMIGRPLMSQRVLAAMMHTHVCGLKFLAPDEKIRAIARSSPLISMVLTPPIYPLSKVLRSSPDQPEAAKWVIPWGVKATLPNESLEKLKEAKLAAILYCAAPTEMSKWIQWFEHEDKARTFTNTLLAIGHQFQEMASFEKNLCKIARPLYKKAILEFYRPLRDPKEFKTLVKIEFAPADKTNLFDAYKLIITCLRKRRKKHFEDFQRFWKGKLEQLFFENLNYSTERRNHFLKTYFSSKDPSIRKNSSPRWETSKGVDRQLYGLFIDYFVQRFLKNPCQHQVEGEIALFLWTMVYISRTCDIIPIHCLLKLTTANVTGQFLLVGDKRIELSLGWAYLIQEYLGKMPRKRHQKLFPNLTIDKLEDYFRKASSEILPSKATLALPEAFQVFPHPEKGHRVSVKERHRQQQKPSKVFHDPISLEEIKQQLIEKATFIPA
jgi:hypothetical protein